MKKIYLVTILYLFYFSNQITAQCSTPSVVPYFEDFQSMTVNNQLPACWAISNSLTCTTFTSSFGNLASFYYTPAGSSYFYTNAIQMNAGVVYSVSTWYVTQLNFGTTWTEFSILINTSQSSTGATTIVSANAPVNASLPSPLSNTFSVPNSGNYFIIIKGVSNGSSSVNNLSWDDLALTIPCTASINPVNLSITANSTLFCQGSVNTFTASGASTYSWSNGSTGAITTYTAMNSGYIQVIGTNSLTGCSATKSLQLTVNPSPSMLITSSSPNVCLGKSVNLIALGASSYTWDGGQNTATITVTPTVSTSYTVTGSNTVGCTNTAVQSIQVNPLPNVSVISTISSNTFCNGDQDTLIASGASNYSWSIGQNIASGNQLIVSPNTTTKYIVTGTDNNGCESQDSLELIVNACTGINQIQQSESVITVAPNPFQEEFVINTGNYEAKKIEIIDLTGRHILSLETTEKKLIINTRYYSKGLYYVKVSSEKSSALFKLIKN